MKRAVRFAVAGVTLGLILALAALALLVWDWQTPYRRINKPVLVTVAKGMHAGQVLEAVTREGVVRNRVSLKLAYALFGHPRGLRAGTYRFDRPLTPLQVIEKLNRGEVIYIKVTIPEGLRLDEVVHLLSEAGLGREEALQRAASSPGAIRDLDPQARTLEGYLFPETYLLDPTLSETVVVQVLVKGFRNWWSSQDRALSAEESLHHAVVLASLVEKEAASARERPIIAGVFANRLDLGMPLQTDPTIVYAQSVAGVYRGFLTRMDWGFASAYNTYLHPGLPPGPICSPGRAALEAALHPEASPFLYFVSRNDGTHAFSRTLDEHNRAVAFYQHGGGKKTKDSSR
jgi:UPF0755 protein